MAEQFGVIRRDHERRAVEQAGDLPRLLHAAVEKMLRVAGGGLQRGVAVVNLLVARAAGDAVILDAGEPARFRRRQVRFDVIEIEVEADVAVKIAVARVAGVAFVLAPDLPRGIVVAAKGGDAVGRENRRKGAVTRARPRVQHAVRVEDEPADVRLLQKRFDAVDVGAFRQPDAARVAAKATPVMVARGQNLRAEGRRMVRQQRQQPVRRGGGDDFDAALVLKFAERGDEVAAGSSATCRGWS